jgi:hypothetical protein
MPIKIMPMLKQIVYLSLSGLLCLGLVQAEESSNFSLPGPPGGSLKDTHQMRMGGTEVFSLLYLSSQPQEKIIKFYQEFFSQNEFKAVFDRTTAEKRILRVKKENRIVNVVVMPKDQHQTQVVIAHYLLVPGLSEFEAPKPSWQEIISALPKEDGPGEDLSFIPRPLESIRLTSITYEKSTYISYTSVKSAQETREFYKSQMQILGWQIEEEIDTQEATQRFKQFTGKTDLKVGLPSGVSLDELVAGGYILNFKSAQGKAQISIINNSFSKDKPGSFVQIKYVKE